MNNSSISHIKIKQELRQGSVKYVNIAFQYKNFEQASVVKAINLIVSYRFL